MDIIKLNQDFERIAEKKTALTQLDKESEGYGETSKALDQMLDQFIADYGTYLEEVLYEIHDEYCPDSDVMSPLAYIANKYVRRESNRFEVESTEGVEVYVDDFPEGNHKMVMVPSPCRLVIQNEGGFKEIVWQAGS